MAALTRDITIRLRNTMRAERAGGMAYDDIAIKNGVARSTAYRHCHDVDVPAHLLPKKGPRRKVSPAKLAQLRSMGVSVALLAERYSVTRVCIYHALRRAA